MHGPLLFVGSQAWSSDESQNSDTKCLVQVKCNTFMHQAIIILKFVFACIGCFKLVKAGSQTIIELASQ